MKSEAKVIDFKFEKSKRDMKKTIGSMVVILHKAISLTKAGEPEKVVVAIETYQSKVKELESLTKEIHESMDEDAKNQIAQYVMSDIIDLSVAKEQIGYMIKK